MTTGEKEFVLSHVFKAVSSMKDESDHFSPAENRFGVPWKIGVERRAGHFGMYLHCLQERKDKEWTIEVWKEHKIRTVTGISNSLADEVIFESADKVTGWGRNKFVKWEDLMKHYVIDNTLKVDVRVKIKKMTGIILKEKKNLRNFDESTKQFSDVVLVVENQKFYVSKLYLASHASYFEAMFLRDFKESKQSEIPLKEKNAKDFQNFLELLYGEYSIDESTVEGIAHLANFYDAEMASRKCEQFLIENSDKSLKEKLQLAHRCNLKNLKDYCLSKITTVADIRSVVTIDTSEMDPLVVGALLQKSLSLRG